MSKTNEVVTVTTCGRSGSNFLCEVYEQHGFTRFSDPANHDFFDTDSINHLSFQNGSYWYNKKLVENVVFHNHIPNWAPDFKNSKAILLLRRNKIKQELSHCVWKYLETVLDNKVISALGQVSNPNSSYTDPISIKKHYVDKSKLLDGIRAALKFEEIAHKTLQENKINYQIIYYEDLFSNRQSHVLKQIGLSVKQDTYFKKSRFQASDIIENYDELLKINWREQL